uniref:Uncharacterized protein n=1 Tax=uncultured nuHF1 cluster bacterium HF0130_31E21 TaxID=710728 RepID=E0XTL3_9BACT|nr:hypothetical protein [uncultured nuHF1 cluster bacterium HF0130_31E21]
MINFISKGPEMGDSSVIYVKLITETLLMKKILKIILIELKPSISRLPRQTQCHHPNETI